MSAWPASREWLEQNGFSLEVRRRCSGSRCGMTIEFWRTPSGRLMPLNVIGNDTQMLGPHWESCKNEKEFRSKPAQEKAPKPAKPEKSKRETLPQTGRLF